MKYFWLCVLLLTADVYADRAQLAADVSNVKQSVLELNQALYQLEQDLLSPSTTQIAFYVSLRSGEYFEPLGLEIRAGNLPPVHHLYTERQVQALRLGAVQPVASMNIGPGRHQVQAILKGVDQKGQPKELTITQIVEKTAKPLLLEVVISDMPEQRLAEARLRAW